MVIIIKPLLGFDVVLRINASSSLNATNAHVEERVTSPQNYATRICISSTPYAAFSCINSAVCGPPYTCVASISNVTYSSPWITNAHIGDCLAYGAAFNMQPKVCCARAITPPPVISISSSADITVPLGGHGRLIFTIKNVLAADDEFEISIYGDPSKLHNWIWLENHRYDENKYKVVVDLKPGEEKAISVNIFGGEFMSANVRATAKSMTTGLETEVSKSVNIFYSDDSINVKTPEIGWSGFAIVALIGALLVMRHDGRRDKNILFFASYFSNW